MSSPAAAPTDRAGLPPPTLRPALGVLDLVLLNVGTIVGLRWMSTGAQLGPASLSLWAIASLAFFVPSGLAVQELSSRIPHVGGLYQWTREAFGDIHGFMAGWSYALSNVVFFPSLLLFIAGVVLHVGGGSWLALGASPLYNGLVCLGLFWAATLLNVLGLERAKWLQNLGGICTLLAAALILGGGALVGWRYGSATSFTRAGLVPHLGSPATLSALSIMILGYVGLELGPILGEEVRDSARTIRRATVIAGVVIAAAYMAGTAALLVALPADRIGAIAGIPEALEAIGQRCGIPHLGAVAAVLMAVASLGALGGWISTTARLPFAMGLGHYLPDALAAIHPKYGSPHVALLTQAVCVSIVVILAVAGSAIGEAYLLLIDMTVALNCIDWMYIFAALGVLRSRAAGRNEGVAVIPGGPLVCWTIAGVGFIAMTAVTLVSLVPPEGSLSPILFVAKGVGGCVLIFASGAVIAQRGRRRYGAAVGGAPEARKALSNSSAK